MQLVKKRKEGKKAWLLSWMLLAMYNIFKSGSVRSIIRRIVLKLEGGELLSLTIREIFSKHHYLDIGLYSAGGCFIPENFTNKPPGTKIGRYCSIAHSVFAFNANHPMNLKSTSAIFYNPDVGYVKKDLLNRTRLTIGNDVWIGHNAVILPSVSNIGDGAVIGAGSVVFQNVPSYAVVVGHPARVVRYRFSEKIINELIESKWWDEPIEKLMDKYEEFQKPLDMNPNIR